MTAQYKTLCTCKNKHLDPYGLIQCPLCKNVRISGKAVIELREVEVSTNQMWQVRMKQNRKVQKVIFLHLNSEHEMSQHDFSFPKY